MLGDDIEVRILEITDGKIRIGIEAPKELTILRKEIYEQVVEENKNAVETSMDILVILSQNSK